MVQNISNLNLDMFVSMPRSQIHTLEGILRSIEQGDMIDEYVHENLKRVEKKCPVAPKTVFPLTETERRGK